MDYQSVVIYTVINIVPRRFFFEGSDRDEGCVTWIKNKIKSAVTVYLYASKNTSENGMMYGNLACMYYKQGMINLAIETYRQAIDLKPNFPDAYCNLGNALKEKGQVAEAEECYSVALRLCPSHVDTLNNLGNVKREQGDIEEAMRLYLRALELFPNFAATHNNLATLLQQQGKLKKSLRYYKQAIICQPNFADAYSNMGNALRELNDVAGAVVCFRKAIEINPSFADAYCNLASIYKELGKIDGAIRAYRRALHLKPDFPDAFCNLAHCLQIICDWSGYEERMKEVVLIVEDQLANKNIPSIHPHHSMLYPITNENRKKVASSHSKLYSEKVKTLSCINYSHPVQLNKRIRIGYISSDFGDHPTSHLMQAIPGLHDSSKVEIFCYALNPDDNTNFRKKIVCECEHFQDLSNYKNYLDAAKKINEDGIHILINMNGYTKGAKNEIFALRPSPIQVMWLGYPGTSGADFMDYIITDVVSSPTEHKVFYSEKFACMPKSYFIGDHMQMFPHLKKRYIVKSADNPRSTRYYGIFNCSEAIDVRNLLEENNINNDKDKLENNSSEICIPYNVIKTLLNYESMQVTYNGLDILNGIHINKYNKKMANGEEVFNSSVFTTKAQYNIPEDAIIYCNFNQLYKINPEVMIMWIHILKEVPKSFLWLLSFPTAGESNILRFAKENGLEPNRIIFSQIACKEEHVRRGQLADVCLDTPLCNGHTTTMDILWTGTPVVTLPGDTLASRVASSQLTALECTELIARDKQEYLEIAVKLGTNNEYLKYMQGKISKARLNSTLFQPHHYAKNLEILYQKMWDRYEKKIGPDHLCIYD